MRDIYYNEEGEKKMDRLRWTEKTITFRNLVDNPAIEKPALGRIFEIRLFIGKFSIVFFLSSNWYEINYCRRKNSWKISYSITL